MNNQILNTQIEALLDNIDNQADIAEATQLLHKRFFEKSLNAELDQHLGYKKNQTRKGSNSRNGTSRKTLHTEDGKIQIDTPRDREGSFDPERGALRSTASPERKTRAVLA